MNVLVYAHQTETAGHEQSPDWPVAELDGPARFTPAPLSSGLARGNLVPDAYHAALAIEHGCEWITTDRDYARFTGLRWRHPLDAR